MPFDFALPVLLLSLTPKSPILGAGPPRTGEPLLVTLNPLCLLALEAKTSELEPEADVEFEPKATLPDFEVERIGGCFFSLRSFAGQIFDVEFLTASMTCENDSSSSFSFGVNEPAFGF